MLQEPYRGVKRRELLYVELLKYLRFQKQLTMVDMQQQLTMVDMQQQLTMVDMQKQLTMVDMQQQAIWYLKGYLISSYFFSVWATDTVLGKCWVFMTYIGFAFLRLQILEMATNVRAAVGRDKVLEPSMQWLYAF